MDTFDYAVPAELETQIRPGQLVKVPFRKSTLYGLVFRIHEGTPHTLKPLSEIVHTTPYVDQAYIDRMAALANIYGVSYSTIFSMGLLPLQKRKIQQFAPTPLKSLKKKKREERIETYTSEEDHTSLLEKTINGTTLILVPEIMLAEKVFSLLSESQQEQSVLWHSGLSVKDQFTAWTQIRNSEKTIIIGTRGAILLPIPNLEAIIVDYEHDENHKHWDQLPRFDARDIAKVIHQKDGVALHSISYTPSLNSYFAFNKKKIEGHCAPYQWKDLSIENMKDERLGGNKHLFSEAVTERLQKSTEDIFVLVHKKGSSTHTECTTCGYLWQCPVCGNTLTRFASSRTLQCKACKHSQSLPTACSICKGTQIQDKKNGSEYIESVVKELFANTKETTVIRIDNEEAQTQKIPEGKRRIIIGTRAAFPYVRWNNTDCVLILDTDMLLSIPEYTMFERIWHELAMIDYSRKKQSTLHIQTWQADHLLFRSIREPERFYRTDLNSRMTFVYPPYCYLTRFVVSLPSAEIALKEAKRVRTAVTSMLTKNDSSSTVSDPFPLQPGYFRGRYWAGFVVKCTHRDPLAELERIQTCIPGSWKIDPNPVSIVSP